MFIFENLLRNEYIPSELPPCFNSESYADNYQAINNYVHNKQPYPSDPLTFSGYKNINSRRKFAIPNPYHYAIAVEIITNNSSDIFNVFNKVNTSLTVPLATTPDKNESYKKTTNSISESKEKIKKLYLNNLYEIRLDIQSFFDSIYTHSIAWAMHTKTVAKQNKQNNTLAGNLLDKHFQALNSGQTNGVLVGNALSRIISEIILCTVDIEIKKKLPNVKYHRFVDDYYIFIDNSSQINNILSVFRQELAKFELMLNENKLEVNESPFIYGSPWVEQMRAYAQLESYLLLEKSIIEYHKYKDLSILKYALKVIRTVSFSSKEWDRIQPILINIWVKFPSLSKIVTFIFKNNENNVKVSILKRSIYTILDINIPLKNDEEVIWTVWICKVFNIQISQHYIKQILNTDNWLAIIILLDVLKSKKGEVSTKRIIDKFRDRIMSEYFSDPNDNERNMHTDIWLLAYEADKNKWLNTSDTDTFLLARKHPFFKELRKLDIDFYDSNFSYDTIREPINKSNIYVTRQELIIFLKEYIDANMLESDKFNSEKLSQVDENLFEKIANTITNSEVY